MIIMSASQKMNALSLPLLLTSSGGSTRRSAGRPFACTLNVEYVRVG
jgi:hypothetical protein